MTGAAAAANTHHSRLHRCICNKSSIVAGLMQTILCQKPLNANR